MPDFDFVIIGSGFGGSVSALRLVEKGYSVAVIERGRRWTQESLPKTNWNVRKYLWAPKARCFGIQGITTLRDVMVLHGCGVGGGSLVYAAVLMSPPDEVFQQSPWGSLGEWKRDLAPHYAAVRNMLGVTRSDCLGDTDHMLREIAEEMECGHTFHSTEVGTFFGEPGRLHADPYFGGEGPERTGCTLCGGALGTVPLLLKCKERGSLPRISERLGALVRTNSEALVGSTSRQRNVDYSKGIAIASAFRPDDVTTIEMVRYGAGQDFMSLIATVLVRGGPPWPRPLRFAGEVLRRPPKFLRLMDGDSSGSLPEVIFNLTTTAHILGGCCMGHDPSDGVIDKYGRVFNYDNFYVADGSIVPVNLRVNPSLTIAALSEWVMSHIPAKSSTANNGPTSQRERSE